jgi:hypothetical protein
VDKAGWLQMAAGWELLAQSYGQNVRLENFLLGRKRKD